MIRQKNLINNKITKKKVRTTLLSVVNKNNCIENYVTPE